MNDIAIVELEEVDSTMFEAERRIEAGFADSFVVVAKAQTSGNGRYGRPWTSPPGNLYWTMAVPRQPGWPEDHGLTFGAGLAVADTLAQVGVVAGEISLKWPNDPLVRGRKISGILARRSKLRSPVELRDYVVIGIGINILSYPVDAFFPAISLSEVGIDGVSAGDLARTLTSQVAARLEQWKAGGLPALIEDYRSRLHGVGELVKVATDRDRTSIVEGVNLSIDDTGALHIKLSDGSRRVIQAGDVLPGI